MDVGFKEINQWHLDHKWESPKGVGCGYHFIIRRNGIIEVGRTIDEKGAHVEGANFDSIGICLIGTHEFNQNQITSLKRIIDGLLAQFPNATIHEHREFPSAKAQGKTCPNINVKHVLGI
jgi:N-acetylmuramoyl-L-alanine amidase